MSNSKDAVIARISSLLKEQKKTQKELMEYLGIGHGAFTHWKNDDRKSFYQYIAEISNFLNTTPNYLLLGQQANMGGIALSVRSFIFQGVYSYLPKRPGVPKFVKLP